MLSCNFYRTPFIVTPVAVHGSLTHCIKAQIARGAPPTAEDRVIIVAQVAAGLAAVHGMGFMHRDLKPGNVLVYDASPGPQDTPRTPGEFPAVTCKIADMGTAVRTDSCGRALTYPCCTRWYRAPELTLNDPEMSYGPSVDIWALGALAVEVFTGEAPCKDRIEEYSGQLDRLEEVPLESKLSQMAAVCTLLGPPPDWNTSRKTARFRRAHAATSFPRRFDDVADGWRTQHAMPASVVDVVRDAFDYDPAKRPDASAICSKLASTTVAAVAVAAPAPTVAPPSWPPPSIYDRPPESVWPPKAAESLLVDRHTLIMNMMDLHLAPPRCDTTLHVAVLMLDGAALDGALYLDGLAHRRDAAIMRRIASVCYHTAAKLVGDRHADLDRFLTASNVGLQRRLMTSFIARTRAHGMVTLLDALRAHPRAPRLGRAGLMNDGAVAALLLWPSPDKASAIVRAVVSFAQGAIPADEPLAADLKLAAQSIRDMSAATTAATVGRQLAKRAKAKAATPQTVAETSQTRVAATPSKRRRR